MITIEKLPGVKYRKRDSINYRKESNGNYCLYPDGSVSRTSEIDTGDIFEIINKMGNIGKGTVLQFHRTGGKKYITIQKYFNNEIKIPFSSISIRKIVDKNTKEMEKAIKSIDNIMKINEDMSSDIVDEMLEIEPMYNMSLIRTAEERVTTLLSISSIEKLKNTFKDNTKDHDMVVTIIFPKEREDINEAISQRIDIISKINEDVNVEEDRYSVHTMKSSEIYEIAKLIDSSVYADITLMANSDSIKGLYDKVEETEKRLRKDGITIYKHTTTTKEQHLYTMPGYGLYGEHYKICDIELMKRVVALYL